MITAGEAEDVMWIDYAPDFFLNTGIERDDNDIVTLTGFNPSRMHEDGEAQSNNGWATGVPR